jgi:hypothetical protein
MGPENKKRPRRTPLSSEEVANFIALRKRRELIKLQKFKKSLSYKILNSFNIVCFFIYFELLFCFLGPCNYSLHYASRIEPKYGDSFQKDGRPIVAEIDVYGVSGEKYNFVVEEFIKVPTGVTKFLVGKDYLLGKDLKGRLEYMPGSYRLFSASPIIFLSLFVLVISSFAFYYNLNENAYSLMSLTVLNSINIFGILLL